MLLLIIITHTHIRLTALFRDYPGEPVPETHTQPFNGRWSGTPRVGRYQKKHSPTHTHQGHQTSFINFLHLLQSMASSVFSLRAWQSSLTTCLQVLFGLPLGLGPCTSYSMHFFTQSSSSFCSICPYQCSLFCCNTKCYVKCYGRLRSRNKYPTVRARTNRFKNSFIPYAVANYQ